MADSRWRALSAKSDTDGERADRLDLCGCRRGRGLNITARWEWALPFS